MLLSGQFSPVEAGDVLFLRPCLSLLWISQYANIWVSNSYPPEGILFSLTAYYTCCGWPNVCLGEAYADCKKEKKIGRPDPLFPYNLTNKRFFHYNISSAILVVLITIIAWFLWVLLHLHFEFPCRHCVFSKCFHFEPKENLCVHFFSPPLFFSWHTDSLEVGKGLKSVCLCLYVLDVIKHFHGYISCRRN